MFLCLTQWYILRYHNWPSNYLLYGVSKLSSAEPRTGAYICASLKERKELCDWTHLENVECVIVVNSSSDNSSSLSQCATGVLQRMLCTFFWRLLSATVRVRWLTSFVLRYFIHEMGMFLLFIPELVQCFKLCLHTVKVKYMSVVINIINEIKFNLLIL